MAAAGALLVSSGIALMAAPTPASADPDGDAKVAVCKYVGTPGESRLQTGGNPIEVGVSTLKKAFENDAAYEAWLATPTFPVKWTDAQGQADPTGSIAIGFIGEQTWTIADCPGGVPEPEDVTPPAPTFVEPTCTTAPAVQTPTSAVVTYMVSGSQAAGGSVHVVASLVDSETTEFVDGAVTTWDHTFTVPTGCESVSPPQVNPPKAKPHVKAETTTPTVVHAGLAGGGTSTETGLGLTAAGLVLLAGAGGAVLVGADRRTTA
jgi:hypothetical protein